jgi:hypothetical protein
MLSADRNRKIGNGGWGMGFRYPFLTEVPKSLIGNPRFRAR